jgi:hypothetical protein
MFKFLVKFNKSEKLELDRSDIEAMQGKFYKTEAKLEGC